MKPTAADLYFAIVNDNCNELEEMLQQLMPLDTILFRKVSLVSHALYNNQNSILACLVKAGANVNIRTRDNKMEPPLFTACRMNNFAALQILLSAPTLDINQKDFFQRTALWAAVKYRMYRGAKLLLDHGADINTAQISYECPLHLAMEYFHHAELQNFAHLLIRRGCIFTSAHSAEYSLESAVRNKNLKAFRLFILSGVKFNFKRMSHFVSFPETWLADVNFCEWLKSVQKTPLPLIHLSKNVIRRKLAIAKKNIQFPHVNQLQIPTKLKRLIMLVDDCCENSDIEEFTLLPALPQS